MAEKFGSVIGSLLAYSAITIGSYEIAAFAVERAIELCTEDHVTIFDKIKNRGYATVERKEEEDI